MQHTGTYIKLLHTVTTYPNWVYYRILDIPKSLNPLANTCGAAVVGRCRVVWYCVISITANPLLTSPVSYISITSHLQRFFAEMKISSISL